MTTAIEGDEKSAAPPARFLPPGKSRYPLYRRLDGPQGRSVQVRKISPPPGFDHQNAQAVANRHIGYTTRLTGLRTSMYVRKFMVQVRVVTSRLHVYAVSKICPDRTPILSSFQSPIRWITVTTVNMKMLNVKLSLSTTSGHIGRTEV